MIFFFFVLLIGIPWCTMDINEFIEIASLSLHTHTHLTVVECSELQFLFVYVYETAVKEGCVLMRRYMEVCSVYV